MFLSDNKKCFITTWEENTVFGELILQEAVYEGEELVSDSFSRSIRHDFTKNELQELVDPTIEDVESLVLDHQSPFGLSETNIIKI